MENQSVPQQVIDVLESSSIGYLTTISKKGELYSYPVAFYYSDLRVYFVTPISAAKYKMIKENPTVSLIVDNKQLTTSACGAMIQGRARTFSITRTIVSILSLGPKVAGFSKKYPGMLGFYAKGKGLPDERKLYKYRIIQINPTKILYWMGYSFGRYLPKKDKTIRNRLGLKKGKDDPALAQLLSRADDELASANGQVDHDWLAKLEGQVSTGSLTQQEQRLLNSYKTQVMGPSKLTSGEKKLLQKWKKQA
ncbi:MAG TPA: pyridoxamine 5'-phosphate oxidase family protein [Candidatus Dormibacteraeota bacterium]|nr:pyridoxamine 5'-phosphate oxidase family protein [Candidatus Dormibacteraeota bacterium]